MVGANLEGAVVLVSQLQMKCYNRPLTPRIVAGKTYTQSDVENGIQQAEGGGGG